MSGNITANASQEEAVRDLFATRYLTVSAVVIILYDTILSFETERAIIWKSKISAPKAAYVVYRYLMVISTLISLNSTISARNLSDDWCGKVILMISIIMFSADAVGHCLVIFRTFMLWERRPSILRLLCVGSLLVNATAFAFLALSVRSVSGARFIGGLKACAAQVNPKYVLGVWAPQVVFDIYVLALIIWNAMDRPRLPNQKILEVAYEDGLFLILATWETTPFYPLSAYPSPNRSLPRSTYDPSYASFSQSAALRMRAEITVWNLMYSSNAAAMRWGV